VVGVINDGREWLTVVSVIYSDRDWPLFVGVVDARPHSFASVGEIFAHRIATHHAA
jgi:hypothetical protein